MTTYKRGKNVWVRVQRVNGKLTAWVSDREEVEDDYRLAQQAHEKLPNVFGEPEMVEASYWVREDEAEAPRTLGNGDIVTLRSGEPFRVLHDGKPVLYAIVDKVNEAGEVELICDKATYAPSVLKRVL